MPEVMSVRIVVKPKAKGKVLIITELSMSEYLEARWGAYLMYKCLDGKVEASPLARYIAESIRYLREIKTCRSV
jgi:hypothetical protein